MPELNATAASLLGFLHEGPMTGWDLVCAVEASVGNFWNVTRSQVYRELKTLAAAKLVAEGDVGQRDRVPFTLTKAGRQAFAEWIAKEPGPELMRLPIVLTVFFGQFVEPAVLKRFLERSKAMHEDRLAEYRRIRPEVTKPFHREALELGISYEENMIRWLESLPWIRERAPRREPATKKRAKRS